jgi:hypothetical protein
MLIHLTNDISHLIKLSFNTLKSTRGLDALSTISHVVYRGLALAVVAMAPRAMMAKKQTS